MPKLMTNQVTNDKTTSAGTPNQERGFVLRKKMGAVTSHEKLSRIKAREHDKGVEMAAHKGTSTNAMGSKVGVGKNFCRESGVVANEPAYRQEKALQTVWMMRPL